MAVAVPQMLGFCGNKASDNTYFMQSTQPDGSKCALALAESNVKKELGVFVDNKLSFNNKLRRPRRKQTESWALSEDRLTSWMAITSLNCSSSPHVGIWKGHPCLKGLRAEIENVQRHATRLIPGMTTRLQYEERLGALDLLSLEFRRLRPTSTCTTCTTFHLMS